MDALPATNTPSRLTWNLADLERRLFAPRYGPRHTTLIFLYYLAIIISLLLIYGRGDFETAPFVYQGF